LPSGRIWYADFADVLAADDGNAKTVAPVHEMDAGLRALTEGTYCTRGGKGEALPGVGATAGRGRVDVRFAVDHQGEFYVLTKSDGMIKKVVGATATTSPAPESGVRPRSDPKGKAGSGSDPNPVASTPESVAAGKKAHDANCAACHGNMAHRQLPSLAPPKK
jgi:hypothetical protein